VHIPLDAFKKLILTVIEQNPLVKPLRQGAFFSGAFIRSLHKTTINDN
jgi:hypothetical protein